MEWILIRHGETTGDSHIRLNGATDVPLSELGAAQAQRAGQALAGVPFDILSTSPMARARQTAAHAFGPQAESAEIHPGFREVDFGAWETWTWEEVRARDPEGYRWYQEDPFRHGFPEGDSPERFEARIRAQLEELLTAPPVERRILVLHKGVIKRILKLLLKLSEDQTHQLPCDLGSIHRLRRGPKSWDYVVRNRVDHLGSTALLEAKP